MIFKRASEKHESLNSTLSIRSGVVMLLLFYIAAFVYSPVGVPHIHDQDEVHKGDACFKDACHIAIFHPGEKGGCNHRFHFTKAREDCDVCNVILPRQILSQHTPGVDVVKDFSFGIISYINEVYTVPVLLHADRGPPSLI